jgi:hypothetical protein
MRVVDVFGSVKEVLRIFAFCAVYIPKGLGMLGI